MIMLSVRNLFQNKIRLTISIGGVALALSLILSLNAIFAGVEERITAYINNSGADIFIAQSGVQNMHMASSSLPVTVEEEVKPITGVEFVTAINYVPNMVVVGDERNLAYIIGLPPGAKLGGPWKIFKGASQPNAGEAIIDRYVAEKSGVGIGDEVEIFGSQFVVAGLSEETASLVNSFAFISRSDFSTLRSGANTVNFVLIKAKPDENPERLAETIEAQLGNVTARTTAAFSMLEKKVVKDMSTDVINLMNLIGFLIGLAVMALTVYTATLSRRSEYGVLKALGASNSYLYITVITQALISVAIGVGVGTIFTWLVSKLILGLGLNLTMNITAISLVKVGSLALLIGGFSAVLPIRQISKLDPATVFRGR